MYFQGVEKGNDKGRNLAGPFDDFHPRRKRTFFPAAAGRPVGGRKIINRFGSSTSKVTNPPSGISTP